MSCKCFIQTYEEGIFFLNFDLFYEVLDITSMHILGYRSCPRTLGTEDQVCGGTRTHDLVVESPVP